MKATRLSNGGGSVAWQAARFASTITWSFVLPVVAAAFLGRWVSGLTERPIIGLATIGLGVAIGLWAAGFQLWNLLHGDDAEDVFSTGASNITTGDVPREMKPSPTSLDGGAP